MSNGNGPSAVAVIGLGSMGFAMASRLASTGETVLGFDPSTAMTERAVAHGIRVRTTIADACRDAAIIVLAVRDGAQAHDAVLGAGGIGAHASPGAIVILTSTVGAEVAVSLGEELGSLGVRFIDAPISGGPARAAEGDLLIVIGGEPQTISDAYRVLNALGSTVSIIGPRAGDGQLFKLINQLLAGVHIAAAAEALTLARAVGLDPNATLETLQHGAAASFMLGDRGPRIVAAFEHDVPVRSRVDLFIKDLGLVGELARSARVPVPVSAAAGSLFLLAEHAGLGASDDSTIATILAHNPQSASQTKTTSTDPTESGCTS